MTKADKVFSFMLDYTTRNMRRYAAEVFANAELGLTVDQWGALLLLKEHPAPLSNKQLAEGLLKDTPTTTRIVDILVRMELVVRAPAVDDRRQMQISISRKGKTAVRKAEPVVQGLRKKLGSALTQQQHETLLTCLNLLNEKIDLERTKGY